MSGEDLVKDHTLMYTAMISIHVCNTSQSNLLVTFFQQDNFILYLVLVCLHWLQKMCNMNKVDREDMKLLQA